MVNIIQFIIAITLIILIIYLMFKFSNKSTTWVEKIACLSFSIVCIILLSIYFLDRYNIPTELELNTNVNTQNWLNFVSTFVTGILGTGIGVLASALIAIHQINENSKDNAKRDKENIRIQNMPMLKYEINTTIRDSKDIDLNNLIVSRCNPKVSKPYYLSIFVKNIGLNNIKRITVDFESPIVNTTYRIMGKNTITSIEKNEIKNINRYFSLENEKEYQMKLKVYYEDVLKNWYYQTVDIIYNTTNGLGELNYKINEEVLIDVKEIPLL